MKPEIGSDFWLTESEYNDAQAYEPIVNLPLGFSDATLTNLCRTGIELFLDRITNDGGIALVPEFTCHSVVNPFLSHGYRVYSYALNEDFTINTSALNKLAQVISPDVILVHNYFGFRTINVNLRDFFPNAIIIDDLTQRLFSTFPTENADCYVGSIRKWMPIPDGGFYYGSESIVLDDKEDSSFVNLELNALLEKWRFISGETTDSLKHRNSFARARTLLDARDAFCSMSQISKKIYNLLPLNQWKDIRKENGRYLIHGLLAYDFLEIPFNVIDDDITPFLIPVFVKGNRNDFQNYLAENKIYATIIWTCPDSLRGELSSSGKFIYDHILCFHCDHRYGLDDMQRICDVIRRYQK